MTYTSIGTFYANEPIIINVPLAAPAQAEYTSLVSAVIQLRTDPTKHDALYEFSAGAEWGETITFDVSSAFRAELAKKQPLSPDGPNYGGLPSENRITLYIAYGARYLFKGEEAESISNVGAYAVAWRGGRSEAERLMENVPDPYEYTETDNGLGTVEARYVGYARPATTKPKEWETINASDIIRLGYYNADIKADIDAKLKQADKAYYTNQLGDRMLYIEDNPYRRNMMFENHLGFIESASCMTRDSKNYKITSEPRSLSHAPSYAVRSSIYVKKSDGGASWKMSSGFVTREWAEWFATEFLMSPRHWMRINSRWIPVSITPDAETVTIYDESKGEMTAINFTVTAGIKGRL